MSRLNRVPRCYPSGWIHEGIRIMESSPRTRKPYERPTVTRLRPEQAKLKLLGHAGMGHQGAKDLMERMFHEASSKDSSARENSP